MQIAGDHGARRQMAHTQPHELAQAGGHDAPNKVAHPAPSASAPPASAPGETLRRMARDPRPAGADEAALASVAGARSASTLALKGFPSADAAAQAALDRANPMSVQDNLEFGGKVFRDERSGRYSASLPRAGTDQGFDPTKVQEPSHRSWVGDYHTHGDYSTVGPQGEAVRTSDPAHDDFNSNRFSRQDLRGIAADAQGRAGYTGYLGTPGGDYRRFDPVGRTDTVFARRPGAGAALARSAGSGAATGGLLAGGLAVGRSLSDGQLDAREARQAGQAAAQGTAVGGGYALAERGLTRGIDRALGIRVETAAVQAATRAGASDAGAVGAAARAGLTRLGGAGAAGAVLSAGLSVYDNREGLARGDAQAVGRVAGDTVVGTSAALSGAAAGAAVGSVVPVLGTAVGAAVGLGAGLLADHLMRAGGLDQAVEGLVTSWLKD